MTGNDPNQNPEFNPNDLASLFTALSGAGGGDPWVTAAQIATSIANDGGQGANLDPLVRMAIEDLAHLATMHVSNQPGITLSSRVQIRPVSKGEWTTVSLDAYKPFFSRFGEALGSAGPAEIDSSDPMAAVFGQMFSSLGPMLVSASAGSMIGHLGLSSMGQYDLPVPRPNDSVLVVPETIDALASEWGVATDELRLWVLIHELTAHAVLSVPHVAKHLESLFIDFASAFRPDPAAIEAEFGDMGEMTDMSQIAELSQKLNDPDKILSMMRSPTHDLLMPQLDALVAAVLGFVSHTVGQICEGLLPAHAQIQAKVRAKTIDTEPADRFMERLLGLDIDASTFTRGERFVEGIVERSGDEGLTRLWADELDLPTAAEVDAPGLWLARIGLDPDLPDGTVIEIPDDLSGLDP